MPAITGRSPLPREFRKRRWRKGSLPPALEQMVWAYAIGRPPQSLDVTSRGPSLASLIAGTADDDDDDDTDAQH